MKVHSMVMKIVLCSTLFYAQIVYAQIEEVVVTAQKREQSAQDVGITITAFDSNSIKQFGIRVVEGIAHQVPNTIFYKSANLPSYTIRSIGLNEFQAQFDSPVAIHVDEVYISKPFMISIPFFDMERIEALKGPQGTLFGRNTTGGAINYYTAKPTDEKAIGFTAYADHHERYSFEGYVGGPINNNLKYRISTYLGTSSGGPWFNEFIDREIGEWDVQLGRGQLEWSNETTMARLMVQAGVDNGETSPYKNPGVFNPDGTICNGVFTGQITFNRDLCLKFSGLAADPTLEREIQSTKRVNTDNHSTNNHEMFTTHFRIEHDLGPAMLTSITGYQFFERDATEDADSSPLDALNSDYYNKMKEFTQELRLTGDIGQLNYVLGAYYETDDMDQVDVIDVSESPLGLAPGGRLVSDFVQELESIAVFAHTEYRFSDSISGIAGIRYTTDTTKVRGRTFVGDDNPVGIRDIVGVLIPVDTFDDKRNDKNVSFKLGLNYSLNNDSLLYGSVTTGFRNGGFSVPFAGVVTDFEDETILNVEGGYKGTLMDNRLQLNLAAFYAEYDDFQVNIDDPISPLFPTRRNAGTTINYGVEMESVFVPTDSWLFKFSVGWLDTEIKDTDGVVTTYSGPIPLEGKIPVNAPDWTISGLARYEHQLTSNLKINAVVDYRWTAKRFMRVTNQPWELAPSYWVANARVGVKTVDDKWELAFVGKNIFDEEYLTYIITTPFTKLDIYGEPASYGLELTYKY